MPWAVAGFALALALVAQPCQAFENMNGEYAVSKTPHAPDTPYNTKWSEYPGGVEYFEAHVGPITSLYSQVFWTDLPTVPLPKDLVERFDGKGMAIVGYEVDQVRKKGAKDVDGSILEEDVSVPINMAYNHHHDAYFTGKGSRMEKVPYDPQDRSISPMAKNDPNFLNLPVEHTPSVHGLPTHLHLAAGNGGEYRKSYHGLPSPVGYVIESPQSLSVTVMQIDTWNREKMNITGSKFVPGPQPRGSLAPRGADAQYSGLLECPLTTRIRKTVLNDSAPFGDAAGTVTYMGGTPGHENNESRAWTHPGCEVEPRESILQNRNPSCDMRTYAGGLQVCKHMYSLLDADQEVPWQDQPLVYYQKYRFYYQAYKPDHHIISLTRDAFWWGIGASGGHAEYDVPKCAAGTAPQDCKHEIWGVITIPDAPPTAQLYFAAVNFHCHAPTCLAMEIWNNRTGELLCRQTPVYGGTGQVDLRKYDEPGYILQPPCLWGDQPGLEPMPLASGTPFMIKAITNNTYGHHGEMAFPEIQLAPWKNTSSFAQ